MPDEPIYVVAAFQRNFSNATMKIISKTSGLSPIVSPKRAEKFAALNDDEYEYNGELFELEVCSKCKGNIAHWSRVRQRLPKCDDPECLSHYAGNPEAARGRLVKLHIGGKPWPFERVGAWPRARRHVPVRLIVLLRDFYDVESSWMKMWRGDEELDIDFRRYYQRVLGFYYNAPTTDKILVAGKDLFGPSSLRNLAEWRRVKRAGWPINPWEAIELVERDRVHYDREQLVAAGGA